jgi:molybdopterin-guanine dinucleotide biosynthesis protein A
MPTEPLDPRFDSLAPAVLAGGRSRRFGRDKLREEIAGRRMIEHPIAALRAVFGPRVAIVGDCDPAVQSAGDAWIPDEHPGIGPIGGIATALRRLDRPVLVIAGDLPAIDASTIRRLGTALLAAPGVRVAIAVTGEGDLVRRHPCAAVYAPSALATIEERIRRERFSLLAMIDSLEPGQVTTVPCDAARLANINEPSDLERLLEA